MADSKTLPTFLTNTSLHSSFDTDIKDTHLIYDYAAQAPDGTPEKWRYEMWFFSSNRIVYAIHGGPMAGRINYQTCTYQCIRPGELWQCNWLEETGTICSLVYDIKNEKITTLIAFSKGHWENAKEARGDKREKEVFERWRGLAKQGSQVERFMLSEQADIKEKFKGKGELVPIEEDAETF
ncbi:putative phenol acid carboxylase [Aureobasidium sp. EXF-10728]|nr:putative phenol acid carboxylase [Aureobasidium sp. EXF-10728]